MKEGLTLRRILRLRPRLRRSDVLWTLLPVLLWYGAFHFRPQLMRLHCVEAQHSCTKENILAVDRFAASLPYNGKFDEWSFVTQNWSGYLAFGVPPLWNAGLAIAGRISPWVAMAQIGTDLILVAQSSLWNGVALEAARLTVQRPRPFVYDDPANLGKQPAHYTSFWSGHTSFAATANTSLTAILTSRGAPSWLIAVMAAVGLALTFLTGFFRVGCARHFPTDVIIGAFAGAWIAYLVARRHRDC